MKEHKSATLVFILTPFVLSFACGLDIYIPIIPQMTQIFDTTPALVQLTLSLFLLVTGVGQLFAGPLSDHFGRKTILLVTSTCFAAGGFWCAFSSTIFELILARIVCSFGACGMLVTAFAIVRDLFSGEKSAQMYSFLNGAIGISPTFAPIIGGFLAITFGWQSVFLFLGFLGVFSFCITMFFIRETKEHEKRVKIDLQLFWRYWKVMKNRQFITHSLIAGCANAVLFCFFSASPFIIISLLKVPTELFGLYFAFFGSVIALGGIISGKIVKKSGIAKTIKTGLFLMLFGGLFMIAWDFYDGLSLSGFLVPMMVACTGSMFLLGGAAAAAMEPFEAIAGTAAAAFGAVEFGVSSIVGSIFMLQPVTSTFFYGVVITLMGLCSTIVFLQRRQDVKIIV